MVFGNCGVLPEAGPNKGYVEMTGIDAETSQDIAEVSMLVGEIFIVTWTSMLQKIIQQSVQIPRDHFLKVANGILITALRFTIMMALSDNIVAWTRLSSKSQVVSVELDVVFRPYLC